MGVKEKIAYAEPTSWLTENMTEEEIQEIVTKAKEKAKKRIAIYDALDSLRDFDMYSPYQKDLSTVIDYIEELEKENEDLKEVKAIYVERPKTMQEKQAESEKYEKAFDDGYENGYAQARFDYEQEPRTEHWISVSDPLNELPRDRVLYVTTELECVEILFYDMTEWSDVDIARSTVAYMDYYEPQPYKAESEEDN